FLHCLRLRHIRPLRVEFLGYSSASEAFSVARKSGGLKARVESSDSALHLMWVDCDVDAPSESATLNKLQFLSLRSQDSMLTLRIRQTMRTFWPCRAFCRALETRSESTIPSELLTMSWVISPKPDQSATMAARGDRAPYALRFLSMTSLGTMPTRARRIRERRWPGRTSCSRGIA